MYGMKCFVLIGTAQTEPWLVLTVWLSLLLVHHSLGDKKSYFIRTKHFLHRSVLVGVALIWVQNPKLAPQLLDLNPTEHF